jgi:RNA polymerase sigma-70 factor, ECF subfamily
LTVRSTPASEFGAGLNQNGPRRVILRGSAKDGGRSGLVRDGRFDTFYDADYSRLVASLTLVTGDRDRARDAVDEAVARACERLSRGRSIDDLGAWLRVVAVNFARGRFRKSQTEARARARLMRLAQESDLPAAQMSSVAVDVRRALLELPRRQREITVLRYFLDLSVAQIAQQFGIAEGTVKSALHSARSTLATLLVESDDQIEVNDGIA